MIHLLKHRFYVHSGNLCSSYRTLSPSSYLGLRFDELAPYPPMADTYFDWNVSVKVSETLDLTDSGWWFWGILSTVLFRAMGIDGSIYKWSSSVCNSLSLHHFSFSDSNLCLICLPVSFPLAQLRDPDKNAKFSSIHARTSTGTKGLGAGSRGFIKDMIK